MKGRNGTAKPPPKAPMPARAGRASRGGAPVETFSRFVSQLAKLETGRTKGGRDGTEGER
ncbi:hypothetical protein [Bosea sp. ANAM02]|uniref:hypothetical protein n=1 Tax=Bosea sp. ANAM02 TaxID=2020412 RepID=UPI00140EDA02|nr:hypothetical protein [Bosea sp. ANAM02]BCB20585.1 hypothetical protein OCUBac02_34790 [Bosea sp. ANAM02]